MIGFLLILFRIAREVLVNFFYYERNVAPLINQSFANNDGILTSTDRKRMRYFGLFIPVVLGYGFALLRKNQMTSRERLTMIRFSAATPLFDDFFDMPEMSVDNLEKIFQQKESYHPQNSKEQLFYNQLLAIKPDLANAEKFVDLCYAIFLSQKSGLEQVTNPSLSFEEIKEISFAKSSQSALLFWSLLKSNFTVAEQELVIQCGRLIQFTDDVYDVWFDLQDGTRTVATNCTSVSELEALFFKEWNLLVKKCDALNLPSTNRTRFLTLQWFFYSRALVAFAQLKKLQPEGHLFQPENFSRQQLVCDMEKWSNRFSWIRFFSSKNF